MIFYVIMHKATGMLMPLGKRNRGYSHWNPAIQTANLEDLTGRMVNAEPVPRLLDTRRKAARCISMWAITPNATVFHDYDGDSDIRCKDDGRKATDLVVVEINIQGLPEEVRLQ